VSAIAYDATKTRSRKNRKIISILAHRDLECGGLPYLPELLVSAVTWNNFEAVTTLCRWINTKYVYESAADCVIKSKKKMICVLGDCLTLHWVYTLAEFSVQQHNYDMFVVILKYVRSRVYYYSDNGERSSIIGVEDLLNLVYNERELYQKILDSIPDDGPNKKRRCPKY